MRPLQKAGNSRFLTALSRGIRNDLYSQYHGGIKTRGNVNGHQSNPSE